MCVFEESCVCTVKHKKHLATNKVLGKANSRRMFVNSVLWDTIVLIVNS